MIEQFLAPENLPFAVALTLMVVLGFIEGIGMVIGLGVSEFFDSMLPDMDVAADIDLDVDADIDLDAGGVHVGSNSGVEIGHMDNIGPFTRMLSWLRIGRVPILILVVIFLLAFGLSGLILQVSVTSAIGISLPTFMAVIPALVFGVGSMNVLGGVAEKILPRDETTAVSADSFIGRVGIITTGTARSGFPAEARLRDQYQQAHYLMVVPDIEGEELGQGKEVLIIRREGAHYSAIENPNPVLSD